MKISRVNPYVDYRGWNLIPGRCEAAVMGSWRERQCSRRATGAYAVRVFGSNQAMLLCTQHAAAANVGEERI